MATEDSQYDALKKKCLSLIKDGQKLQAVKVYHVETGVDIEESMGIIDSWSKELEKGGVAVPRDRQFEFMERMVAEMEDNEEPKKFKSWFKRFIRKILFLAIIFIAGGVIVSIKKPAHIPAKIEEVYYSKSGHPVVKTSPCNAYYLSFFKATRGCSEGISLQLDKFPAGCLLTCRSGLQTRDFGYDYNGAWQDSLKYVSEEEKQQKEWIPFLGKYLTFYFDTGDSLRLFPDNKKIYYDNKYHKAVYAFYYVTPRCKYLLTHCNVIRMKMDAVFDQNEIRKELREELTERFELVDNYVFRQEDVKQTK